MREKLLKLKLKELDCGSSDICMPVCQVGLRLQNLKWKTFYLFKSSLG